MIFQQRYKKYIYHYWLLLVLVIGYIIRVFGALHTVDTLLFKSLPDDAFYYFTIARNIAQGYGVTFDRLFPTNGFHPLWMLLITPWFIFFKGDTAINIALLLSATLDVISAVMIYRVVMRITGREAPAVFSAMIYFLNPTVWMFSINGLETSVNMAVVALLVDRFTSIQEETVYKVKNYVLLGILFGLVELGRTDNIFLIISCGIVLLTWGHIPFKKRLLGTSISAAISVIVTMPWFLWNYITFGEFIQTSGTILPYLEHVIYFKQAFVSGWTFTTLLHEIWLLYQGIMWTGIWAGFGNIFNSIEGSILPVALFLGLLIFPVFSRSDTRKWTVRALRKVIFLFPYVILLFGYHQGIRWVYREWYTIPITWTIVVILGVSYASFLQSFSISKYSLKKANGLIFTIIIFIMLLRSINVWKVGIYSFQGGFLNILKMVDDLPEGSRVGISDSGFLGYRSKQTIVNLDGVVNNKASNALMQGKLLSYVLNNNISYVVVNSRYLLSEFWGADFRKFLKQEPGYWKIMFDERERQEYFQILPNGRIDVSSNSGRKYLGDGWDREEKNAKGVWVDDDMASVYFFVDPLPYNKFQLKFSGKPFWYDGIPNMQKVKIYINGQLLDEIKILSKDVSTYSIYFPANVLLHNDVNVLKFEFTYSISPRNVGYNADKRSLAMWFDSIEILPVRGNEVNNETLD